MPEERMTRRVSKKKRDTKTSGKSYVRFSDKLTASLEEVNRVIQENKATLDAIQDIALELTRVAGVLEATASKYVSMVDSVLETAVPILSTIPLVPEKTLEVVTELQDLANSILKVCTTADKVIMDVEDGLLNADVTKLKAHTSDLQEMTKALQKVLPASKS